MDTQSVAIPKLRFHNYRVTRLFLDMHDSIPLPFIVSIPKRRIFIVFYDNFERICKERGTSPSRCCHDAGMGTSRAANWKKSGALPKQDELDRLAAVLDCEVADFFRTETKARYRSYEEARAAADEAERAARASLTEDENYVVDLMRSLERRSLHDFMTLVYDFEDNLE